MQVEDGWLADRTESADIFSEKARKHPNMKVSIYW